MKKRVVIAGCRNYNDYAAASEYISSCIKEFGNNVIIVSGAAKGADSLGERYAKENNLEIERYPADWEKYGRGAGPKRNMEMAKAADLVICFWDGESRGTKSMIKYAEKLNKPVKIKIIETAQNK